MGLFGWKKDQDGGKKKADGKPAAVRDEKKELKGAEDKKKEKDKPAPKKDAIASKQSMKDLYGGDRPKTGAEAKRTEDKKGETKIYGNAYRILVKPLITEKAANLGADNKYVFAVETGANKIEVAKAIKEVYGIKPTAVNIIRTSGKKVRHGKLRGKRKDWKKAMVTLPKGKSINIYEGV